MLECLILGDSIAAGTHQFMPKCEALAHPGKNSHQWNREFAGRNLTAKNVIISLGTNDHQYVKTTEELEHMRKQVHADNVFWVLPMGNSPKSGVSLAHIQSIVRDIARLNGDTVITTNRLQADGIHPSWAGYKELANSIK